MAEVKQVSETKIKAEAKLHHDKQVFDAKVKLRTEVARAEAQRGKWEAKAAAYGQQIYVPETAMRRLAATYPVKMRSGNLTMSSDLLMLYRARDKSQLARDIITLTRSMTMLHSAVQPYDRARTDVRIKKQLDARDAKMREEVLRTTATMQRLLERIAKTTPGQPDVKDAARDYLDYVNGNEHTMATVEYVRYANSVAEYRFLRDRGDVLFREFDDKRIQLMTRFTYSTTPAEVLLDDEGFPEAGIDEIAFENACDARNIESNAQSTRSTSSSMTFSSQTSHSSLSTASPSPLPSPSSPPRTRSRVSGEHESERKTERKRTARAGAINAEDTKPSGPTLGGSGGGDGGGSEGEGKAKSSETNVPGEKMCRVVAQWRADARCTAGSDEEAISAISTDTVPSGERMRLRFRLNSGPGGHMNLKTVVRCFGVADLKMLVARARVEEKAPLDPESRVPLSDAQIKRIDDRVPSQAAIDTLNADVWEPFRDLLRSPTRSLEVVQQRTYLARLLYWLRQGSHGAYNLTDKADPVSLGTRYTDDAYWLTLAAEDDDPGHRYESDKPPPIRANTRRQATYHE
jgi:hypothetical protein